MKKMIIVLMAQLCLNFIQAQESDLRHYAVIDGGKYWVDRLEKRVKKVGNTHYALVNGKFYKLQYAPPEGNVYTYEFYVTLEDNTRYYITRTSYGLLYELMDLPEAAEMARSGRRLPYTGPLYSGSKPYDSLEVDYTSTRKYKVYALKVTPEKRIIPDEEFQSYRGNFTYVRRIEGGPYAMDTIIIKPPGSKALAAMAAREQAFKEMAGKIAPYFDTQSLSGIALNSDSLRNKVVVINFWFVGCPPCLKEIPALNQLVADYEDREVVFIGFATDTEQRLNRFLARTDFEYTIVPLSLNIADQYLVNAYPSHFVIDKQGIVRLAEQGFKEHTMSKLRATIEESLKQ